MISYRDKYLKYKKKYYDLKYGGAGYDIGIIVQFTDYVKITKNYITKDNPIDDNRTTVFIDAGGVAYDNKKWTGCGGVSDALYEKVGLVTYKKDSKGNYIFDTLKKKIVEKFTPFNEGLMEVSEEKIIPQNYTVNGKKYIILHFKGFNLWRYDISQIDKQLNITYNTVIKFLYDNNYDENNYDVRMPLFSSGIYSGGDNKQVRVIQQTPYILLKNLIKHKNKVKINIYSLDDRMINSFRTVADLYDKHIKSVCGSV